MKIKTQKSSLIITILLACVFCIVGLFFAFRSDEKKTLSASAVSSDSENFYFASGANIQTDTVELRMRFTLKINESFFTDNEDKIRCTIIDGAKNENIQFYNYEKTITVLESEANFLILEEGIKTLFIPLCVDMDTSVSIKAEMLDAYNSVRATAYSDARTYDYIHTAHKEATGGTSSSNILNLWAEEYSSYKVSVDKTALSMYDEFWLDSYNGISFAVNVPQNYLDLIAQGEKCEYTLGSPYKYYTSYKLVLRAMNQAPNLTTTVYEDNRLLKYEKIYNEIPVNFNGGTTAILTTGVMNQEAIYWYIGFIKTVRTEKGAIALPGGYYNYYTTESITSTAVDWSDKACKVSLSERAQEILERTDITLTDEQIIWLQEIGKISASTEKIPVDIVYKKLSDENDPSSIYTERGEWFEMPSVYAFNSKFVIDEMYNTKDYTNLADFNVNYNGAYYLIENEEGSSFKYAYAMEQRTILQADGITYKYDPTTERGKLTITYAPYQYKNFGLRLSNNDPNNHLELMYYPTSSSSITGAKDIIRHSDGTIELIFRYNTIAQVIKNSASWCSRLTAEDITIDTRETTGITVTEGDGYTSVRGPEEFLQFVSATAVVDIIDTDTPIKVNCKYADLSVKKDGEIVKEIKETDWKDMTYGDYLSRVNIGSALQWFPEIEEGAMCEEIYGEYMTPTTAFEVEYDANGAESDYKFTLEIGYSYNTMFKIAITENGEYSRTLYKVTNDVTRYYDGEYFVDMIPTGWRVKSITAGDDNVRVTPNAEMPDDYRKTKITLLVDGNEEIIIPITVEMTDVWDVVVNYLETYKNTPFMVKTQVTKAVRVLDYPDIYGLTKEQLAGILEKENVEALKIGIKNTNVDVDKINVTFNGYSTYTVDVTYGFRTLRVIDYDGEIKEIRIPLTSYTEWKNSIGQGSWSIFMLNTNDNTYFNYSTEANENDLYGFFFVSVFEEQVSDFNRLFKNNTSEGQVTVFNQRKVEGSSLYKFFDGLSNKTGLQLFSNLCMAWCEIFNDDNQMVYSYFGYLDGTTENAYMSNGGADNAFDDDSAFENTVQDVGDAGKGFFENAGDWFKNLWQKFRASNWDTVVFVVLGVAGGLLVIGLGWIWGKRYYLWVTAKPSLAPKKSTSKKSTKKKTTAKGKKK